MIKNIRYSILFLAGFLFSASVMAQSIATTSSPYSRYGLGTIDAELLPQQRAMGGIGVAINRLNGYSNINSLNPASYGFLGLTAIDIGVNINNSSLGQTGVSSQSNSNFRLSHVAFGFPVSKRSGISFGIKPYSEVGYNYVQTQPNLGTGLPTDTAKVNYIYKGEGGLSKAYLGYGFGLGKHFYLGGNVSYIFGNLQQFRSTEIPTLYGFLNSRVEQSNSIGGLNYDLGTQVSFDFKDKNRPNDPANRHLTFGYSAQMKSYLRTKNRYIITQYQRGTSGDELNAADSVVNNQSDGARVQLPMIHRFGVSYQKDGKFLVGADYSLGKWSQLTIAGINQGLQNSQSFNVGGQYTPNINQINNYFAAVDYRLGFEFEKTYVAINNTNINQKAITFGLGLPLSPSFTRQSFYKINLSAEIGERGTLSNNLIRERFYNFHIGFMLNDKWFTRYRFE